MIKKIFRGFIVSLCVIVCMAAFGVFQGFAAYSNYVYDYNYDSDSDGSADTYFQFKCDLSKKTAAITGISTDKTKLVIPATLKNVEVDDGKTCTLTVKRVEVDEYSYYNCPNIKSISLSYSINYIEPQGLGYYYEYVYNEEKEEYDKVWKADKKVKFSVTKGTAGETYAKQNGFSYKAMENLTKATVKLSKTAVTYNGKAQKPAVTVTYSGKNLKSGKDYTVSYKNNKNAGKATVTVTGKGNYRAEKKVTFTIKPKSASKAKVAAIANQNYTGKALKPKPKITLSGKTLKSGTDYSVTYSANKKIGTATATVKFKGNYSGTVKAKFKIVVAKVKNFKAQPHPTYVKLTWSKVACDSYKVYRYDAKTKKYKLLTTTKKTAYSDKKLSQLTKYTYRVKAVKKQDKKTYNGSVVQLSTTTKLAAPSKLTLALKNGSIRLNWSKNANADGYQIYRANVGGSFQKINTINDKSKTTWTNSGTDNKKNYLYSIRCYKKKGGKTYYSDYTYAFSGDELARLNKATLKSHRSFKVYNTQGKKSTSYTVTLTDRDVKILQNFIDKHFTSGMNRAQQLMTVQDWINKNVKYARDKDWYQIASKSWVDAIFTYKKGQCVQYNGAMAAMMAYLGYDARLIQGYRGSWEKNNIWQHFWAEVKIEGTTYVMETGNYDSSGSWMYFVSKYSETRGYIKNQKNLGIPY